MNNHKTPEELFGDLFYDIHKSGLFKDGKVVADARAKMSPQIILKEYKAQKDSDLFNLTKFVHNYFDFNQHKSIHYSSDRKPISTHLTDLWQHLKRPADKRKRKDSRIPLPYDYVVPGGRFNEIYYWDSYFTILGLISSGEHVLMENMILNFKYLISTFGHIPNGNRTYFLSRSQPPFYSLMIKELINIKGESIIPSYLPSLVTEYNFWMKGVSQLETSSHLNRVVKINNFLLNRYYDAKDSPREEMYRDDWELIDYGDDKNTNLFRSLRAACESGWDFSSRWMTDPDDLKSIHTTDLLPIDLNCLLWHLEKMISECYKLINRDELSLNYGMLAVNRKNAIQQLFWNDEKSFFCDYDFSLKINSDKITLAGVYPLFFRLANDDQASQVASIIKKKFLKKGGLTTTLTSSGQQWDAPNGWAPLQYMAIKGLLNYGYKQLAQEIAHRWTSLNEEVYHQTGKMLEKYNVIDISLSGSGGEYDLQDGFGWTNGVYLSLTQ